MNIISMLWLTILFLAGCSKNSSSEKDTVLPIITISSPSPGQIFVPGQSITVAGSITDNNYIAEAHIHVSNSNTGALLLDVHVYPAASSTTFHQSITAVAGVNYEIQVIAKDKAVNEARASVEVSCN